MSKMLIASSLIYVQLLNIKMIIITISSLYYAFIVFSVSFHCKMVDFMVD